MRGDSKNCRRKGRAVSAERNKRRYCDVCGTELRAEANFCPSCGSPQRPGLQVPPDPSVPPPPTKDKSRGSGGLSGVRTWYRGLGLIGKVTTWLIVIIVLVLALRACGGNRTTSQTEPAQPSKSASESESSTQSAAPTKKSGNEAQKDQSQETPTVGIGEAVAVGDASWVVTDAQRASQLADTFGGALPLKQGNFVVVDFNFTNNGNDSKTLHSGALQLVDSSGRTSNPDTDTFGYIPSEKNIFLNQVNPGVTQPGEVIFSVSPDGYGYRLLLKDTNLFKSSTNQAYVDLGF